MDIGFFNSDGDVIGFFCDIDGIVYKVGVQIVKVVFFYLILNCVQRSNWKMMVCEELFGQVSVIYIFDKENKMGYIFFL